MKRKLNILTISYLLFLILLFFSGAFVGILSELIYFLAFIIPFGICIYKIRNEENEYKDCLSISRDDAMLFVPLIVPIISLTMIISFVTSYVIFTLTGKTNPIDLGDSYLIALIQHALFPAIFEEALFRYLPMRMIAPHSPRCAIIVSSIFFALVHGNLFQIPYAFIGGVIFMSLNLATGSIIPSLVIHFLNNALSISMSFIYDPFTHFLIYILIGVFTLASLSVVWKYRGDYEMPLFMISDKGEGVIFTWQMIAFTVLALALAVISIL